MPAPPSRRFVAAEERGHSTLSVVVGTGVVVAAAFLVWLMFLRPGEAGVSGKVTLEGQPIAQAQLVFVGEAEDNQAPLVAVTDNDGNYRLMGHNASGIPRGKYRVTLSKLALKDGTIPQGEALDQARQNDLLKNVLPAVYADPDQSPLQCEIRRGSNTVDFPLKKHP